MANYTQLRANTDCLPSEAFPSTYAKMQMATWALASVNRHGKPSGSATLSKSKLLMLAHLRGHRLDLRLSQIGVQTKAGELAPSLVDRCQWDFVHRPLIPSENAGTSVAVAPSQASATALLPILCLKRRAPRSADQAELRPPVWQLLCRSLEG